MNSYLIIGSQGQVGLELQRRIGARAAHFVDRPGLDITDAVAVDKMIGQLRPDVVINAAAYTAVDRAESEPDQAHAVNALGPGHLAHACANHGAALIHLSTDYVFDGSGTRPWREDDPINPLSVYGVTKAAGEAAVRAALDRHLILRTAWVVSPFRGNFVKTMLRLAAERDELRVVDDQFGGPTMAADIAATALTLADRLVTGGAPEYFGTFHYAGIPYVSWHTFAQSIVAGTKLYGGRQPKVTPIGTPDYPTPARRPANSRLDCSKLARIHGIPAPDWRVALADLLAELHQTGATKP